MLFLERRLKRGNNVEIGGLTSYGAVHGSNPRMTFTFGKLLEKLSFNIVCDNEGALQLVRAVADRAVASYPGVFANYGKTAERNSKREAAKWLVTLAQQLIDESNKA